MHKTNIMLQCSCRHKTYDGPSRFFRQANTGDWKLAKHSPHSEECVGDISESTRSGVIHCSSPYTAEQTSRVVLAEVHENQCITASESAAIVRAKGI